MARKKNGREFFRRNQSNKHRSNSRIRFELISSQHLNNINYISI